MKFLYLKKPTFEELIKENYRRKYKRMSLCEKLFKYFNLI